MDNNLFGGASMFGEDTMGGMDLDWGNAGMAAMPEAFATERVDISELIYIKGYIAGRKNTLTPSFDQVRATEEYKAEFERQAGGENSIKIGDNEIKKSFSQKNYKLLLGEEKFNQLNDGTFFKLNVKEGNPEFLVVHSDVLAKSKDSTITQATRKHTSVSSPNSDTLLIKPKALSDILYNVGAMGYVHIQVDGKKLGLFSPQKTDKPGMKKPKIALRYFPLTETGVFGRYVAQLGVIKGIPYAVNKAFEGEPISGEINLSNEKQIKDRYPELMPKLNEIGKTLPREATKGTDQTIPYETYRAEYERMGVTPQMLEKLRKSKSSSREKEYTLADIMAGFTGQEKL